MSSRTGAAGSGRSDSDDGFEMARYLRRELDPVSFHRQRLRRRSRTVFEGIVCPARNCSSDRATAACKRSRSTSSNASPSSSSRAPQQAVDQLGPFLRGELQRFRDDLLSIRRHLRSLRSRSGARQGGTRDGQPVPRVDAGTALRDPPACVRRTHCGQSRRSAADQPRWARSSAWRIRPLARR